MNRKLSFTIILLILITILSSCLNLNATSSIQGKVNLKFTDQLEGTLIKVKGTNITVKTDTEGNFVIKNLKFNEVTLQISREDYDSKEINVQLAPGSIVSVNTELVYKYGLLKGSISGIDENDEIKIYIKDKNDNTKVINQNIIKGPGILIYDKLLPGTYYLEIESNKYEKVRKEITIEKNKITEIPPVFLKSVIGDIEGEIILPYSENLSNTQIIIKDLNGNEIANLLTDANGKFSKKGLTQGGLTP